MANLTAQATAKWCNSAFEHHDVTEANGFLKFVQINIVGMLQRSNWHAINLNS